MLQESKNTFINILMRQQNNARKPLTINPQGRGFTEEMHKNEH